MESSTECEPRTSRCSSWIYKRQRNQSSNCQHPLDHWKSKRVLEKHQYSILTHIYGICKDGNDNPVCETAKETQMYKTVFWTLWEKARLGWFERIALNHVYYHMWDRSPVQVWCMRQGAQGWCTGMTQRDGMGREVQDGEHMYTHGWFMSMYDKNHYNILK